MSIAFALTVILDVVLPPLVAVTVGASLSIFATVSDETPLIFPTESFPLAYHGNPINCYKDEIFLEERITSSKTLSFNRHLNILDLSVLFFFPSK